MKKESKNINHTFYRTYPYLDRTVKKFNLKNGLNKKISSSNKIFLALKIWPNLSLTSLKIFSQWFIYIFIHIEIRLLNHRNLSRIKMIF